MTMPDENQFKELREDIREGFKTINARIDNLVTRNEFSAELRRIDEKHEAHVNSTASQLSSHEAEMEKIVIGNRWGIGIAVAGAGIIVAIINAFVPG